MKIGSLDNFKTHSCFKFDFQAFPNVCLARTYCLDSTVADSACSATAYLGGVKTNIGTLGVSGRVKYKKCKGQAVPENQVGGKTVL